MPIITNRMLSFLQHAGDTRYNAFPCLQKLSLKYCYTSDGALVNIVTSRRRLHPAARVMDARVKSVHITFRLPVTIDQLTSQNKREMESDVQRAHKRDIARLQAVQQDGLHASWSTNVWA
jgi:hypothetical protein